MTFELPIDRELVRKRAYLPVKLAELSYLDQDKALRLLRAWGHGTIPITQLWEEATKAIANYTGKGAENYEKEVVECNSQ